MPGWIRLGRINMLLDVAMLLLNGAMPPKTVVFPNRAYPCGKLSLWGAEMRILMSCRVSHLTFMKGADCDRGKNKTMMCFFPIGLWINTYYDQF